ncbi:MAG: hypothetical protein JNL09_00385 [Anaerolineales bacterium]|nr:hypothetical protein [Anaerolineales bacterium]
MKKFLHYAVGLWLIASLAFSPLATPVVAAPISASNSVEVSWQATLPQFEITEAGEVTVNLPGFTTLAAPGLPRVPVDSKLIAVPPGAQPVLEIVEADSAAFAWPGAVAFNPRPTGVERNTAGLPGQSLFEAVPAIERPAFAVNVVELEDAGVMRGVRLVRLTFYPVRLAQGQWQFTRSVKVRVTFNALEVPAAGQVMVEDNAILDSVRLAVENPADVAAMRAPNIDAPQAAPLPRVFIEVAQTGLTAITPQALTAAGFSLAGVNPANLRLWRGGTEVALEWEGDADASFETGERFLFFAEPRFNRYTERDVYILEASNTAGSRMNTRGSAPGGLPVGNVWHTEVFETNAIYTPDCYCGVLPFGRDGDRWVWHEFTRPGNPAATFPFTLNYPPASTSATLTLWFIGQTSLGPNPDHRVAVSLNGVPIASAVDFDGKSAYTATLTIPAGVLQTSNTLALSLPGISGVSIDGVWLDAFRINYVRGAAANGISAIFANVANYSQVGGSAPPPPAGGTFKLYLPIIMKPTSRASQLYLSDTAGLRAYDVTQTHQPVRLSAISVSGTGVTFADTGQESTRYFVTAENSILSPAAVRMPLALSAAQGKYILITPSAFSSALTPLINLRQSQGLTVTVQNVQAIYDAFDGRPTPEAIRAYIQTAYDTWTPRPEYVLLVGDATSDPKRHKADSFSTYIPAYLEQVDPFAGETAADNRYVTMDGPTDRFPDLMLGRLPVNSLAEAQTAVNKIVSYETTPASGTWNAHVAFVADNADAAGDFPAKIQGQANLIPAPYITQTLIVTGGSNSIYPSVINRWNAGASVIAYQGHSSIHQWAVERVFHLDDVPTLSNGLRLPVLLELTCFTGAFHTSNVSVLDESLVRRSGGGAVAVWGSTSLGLASGHDELSDGFLRQVYVENHPLGYVTLGQGTQAGKLELSTQAPWAVDLLDTFTLLGDPATRIRLAPDLPNKLFLPLVMR